MSDIGVGEERKLEGMRYEKEEERKRSWSGGEEECGERFRELTEEL